jgi:hypothetical protein
LGRERLAKPGSMAKSRDVMGSASISKWADTAKKSKMAMAVVGKGFTDKLHAFLLYIDSSDP